MRIFAGRRDATVLGGRRAAGVALACGLAFSLAACSGHGKYTTEGISLAQQRLNALKAATERDMARQAFLAGDLDKAMRKTDAALALADENAPLHVLKGRVFIERGNIGGALLSLRRALEIDAGSVDAHYYLGVVHERLDEHETALEHFRSAATLDPHNPQYAIAAGEMLIDLGRVEEAKAFLESGETAGHAAGVQQLLGHIAMIKGDKAGACELFGKARLLAPDDGAILEDLAAAQVAAGRFAEAETNLVALLRDPANRARRDLLHLRAECLIALDRPVDAREIYRGLTAGDGAGDAAAWVGLGRVSYTLGDERGLQRAASRVVSVDPKNAGGYVLWAVWQREQGDPAAALSKLDIGLMRAGPDAELLAMRAFVLSEMGRGVEALAAAEAAVSADPTHAAGRALLQRLGGLASVPVE